MLQRWDGGECQGSHALQLLQLETMSNVHARPVSDPSAATLHRCQSKQCRILLCKESCLCGINIHLNSHKTEDRKFEANGQKKMSHLGKYLSGGKNELSDILKIINKHKRTFQTNKITVGHRSISKEFCFYDIYPNTKKTNTNSRT